MKKFTILLSLLLAAFVIVPSSFALDKKPKTAVREVNIEGRYSMMIPEYLTEAYDLNDEASLQYQNIYKEVYIIVIDEPKQDFHDVFLELNEYDNTKSMLENYVQAQIESIRSNMSKVTKEKRRTLKTGCGEAVVYDVVGTQEGIDDAMGFTVGFYEGRLNLYMIMTWTFAKTQHTYQTDMDNMLISFKELSGAIAEPKAIAQEEPDNKLLFIPSFMDSANTVEGATLEYYSKSQDWSIAVIEEPFWKWDSIYASKGKMGLAPLSYVAADKKKWYSETLKDVRSVSELTESKSDSLEIISFSLYGKQESGSREMHYKIRVIKGKNKYYVIQAWTPSDKEKDNSVPMNQIMDTFRE